MTMLSQTTEYALRVVVYLAAQGSTPSTTRQIAGITHVPEGYLAKVLQSLGRAGLVKSQRGIYGGFVLGPDPATLSVLDVIQAVDPIPRIRHCPLGVASHQGSQLCALHHRLDGALAQVEEAFRLATIADLLADQTHQRPLGACKTCEN